MKTKSKRTTKTRTEVSLTGLKAESEVLEPEVFGLRAAFRSVLCENHKLDLGCPTEQKCHLFKNNGGLKACAGCPKHFKYTELPFESAYAPRIKFISRIESMINVGCKFGPNDLAPEIWTELIVLAQERSWVQGEIDRQRRENKEAVQVDPLAQKELDKVRREQGIPPVGQSIFANRPRR